MTKHEKMAELLTQCSEIQQKIFYKAFSGITIDNDNIDKAIQVIEKIMTKKLNAAVLIEKYIEIRDYLGAERRKWQELETNLKSDLSKIEAAILRFQDRIGTESISSTLGTAYRVKKEHYQMGDWDKFIAYVIKTKNYQMLEKRVAKKATKEVLDSHKELSPETIGVRYSGEFAIQIRRK